MPPRRGTTSHHRTVGGQGVLFGLAETDDTRVLIHHVFSIIHAVRSPCDPLVTG